MFSSSSSSSVYLQSLCVFFSLSRSLFCIMFGHKSCERKHHPSSSLILDDFSVSLKKAIPRFSPQARSSWARLKTFPLQSGRGACKTCELRGRRLLRKFFWENSALRPLKQSIFTEWQKSCRSGASLNHIGTTLPHSSSSSSFASDLSRSWHS